MNATRRQLLGRGLGAAGAVAIPGSLLGATTALAQESEETDALERLVEAEQAIELAYSIAAEDGKLKPAVAKQLETFGQFAGDHATALAEALDQLGVDPPEAKSDPAEYDALDGFRASAPELKMLQFFVGLEEGMIVAYESETSALESADLVRSAAQIGAAHAQVLVALRSLGGEPALTPLPPADSSSSDPEDPEASNEEE